MVLPSFSSVPALGEIADELDVLVVLHETVEDLVVDRARCGVVRDDRVQPPGVADGALDEGVRVPLDLLTAGGEEQQKDKKQCEAWVTAGDAEKGEFRSQTMTRIRLQFLSALCGEERSVLFCVF